MRQQVRRSSPSWTHPSRVALQRLKRERLRLCAAVRSDAFLRAKAVLSAMGDEKKIFHAGSEGAGQVAKAANNMLLAIHMIGTCEALAIGAANGLDPAVQSEIMKASSGQ